MRENSRRFAFCQVDDSHYSTIRGFCIVLEEEQCDLSIRSVPLNVVGQHRSKWHSSGIWWWVHFCSLRKDIWSLSLRKSIQLAIRRSTTIKVDSLISGPNSSDNHKTQQKIHWTICSITNYTKIFPKKYLHRNRFFSAKNSLHWTKRQHAQTQEQILNLFQREFCLSNDTKHRTTVRIASNSSMKITNSFTRILSPTTRKIQQQTRLGYHQSNSHRENRLEKTLRKTKDNRRQHQLIHSNNKICNYHKKNQLEHDENTRGTRTIK